MMNDTMTRDSMTNLPSEALAKERDLMTSGKGQGTSGQWQVISKQ